MADTELTCDICWDTLGTNGGVIALACGETNYLAYALRHFAVPRRGSCLASARAAWPLSRRTPTRCLHSLCTVVGHPFCRGCITRHRSRSHRCPLCRRNQPSLEDNGDEAALPSQAHHTRAPQPVENLGDLEGILRFTEARHETETSRRSGLPDLFGLRSIPADEHSLIPERYTATTIMEDMHDLQSNVQSLLARILSVEDRPLVWDFQQLELQRANQQLNDARSMAAPNLLQVMSQIQEYTASVTADFAEFTRQSEQQHQRQLQQQSRDQQQQSRPRANSSQDSLGSLLQGLLCGQQQLQQQQNQDGLHSLLGMLQSGQQHLQQHPSQRRTHSSQDSLEPLLNVLQLFGQLFRES